MRGIVFFTGHNPNLQKMAFFVIPRVNGYISTNSSQNGLTFSGALGNIIVQDILQFQSDKIKGVEVMHVLAMSGMSFWTLDNLIELEMYKKL